MIGPENLYRIQSNLAKGAKTIPIKTIEKDYVFSWILVGIAKSRMSEMLSFKGGTALKKFYFPDYRFSEDLDFTTMRSMSADDINEGLERVYTVVLDDSNIRLALKNSETHEDGYTFFVNYSGPLGADLRRREIKTDFTVNEKLVGKPLDRRLLREYDEYQDIPLDIHLKVYSLEEIFIEKCLSILDRARSEPRDVYDLWYLASERGLTFEHLGPQIIDKGHHKGTTSFDLADALAREESKYKRLWEKRLIHHVIELPHFEKVYRELERELKPLNLELRQH